MKQHKQHHRTVLTILAIYLVILVGTILKFDAEAFPKPTLDGVLHGSWAHEVEDYFTGHLGFHDTLFRIKSGADLAVGEKIIEGVYVTDEKLLEKLYAVETPDAAALAEPVNRFYDETGIPTFMLLVPSASDIYANSLPANAVNEDQEQLIRAVYAETENGVRCMDVCHVLSSARTDYIYYRTDTRWTCYGAFCAYQNAIQKMGFTAVPYQRYVISHLSREFRGDLYQRTLYSGVKPDMLDYYTYERGAGVTSVTAYDRDGNATDRGNVLYSVEALRSDDMYRFYLGEPCEKLVIKTNVESGKKLLLFKDSFADCMVPFLLQHYSEICVVDLATVGEDYLTAADPENYTQALFLCSMKGWEEMW